METRVRPEGLRYVRVRPVSVGRWPSSHAPPAASYSAMVAMTISKQPHSQKNPTGRSSRKLLASWRMFAFVSRATQARSGVLGLLGASSIGTSPQASDTLTLERFSPGSPVRLSGNRSELRRKGVGQASVDDRPPDYLALIRLVGATELLLTLAEQVNGEIADEAILAELYELRDRACSALRSLSER
jgi:hypothetical protein